MSENITKPVDLGTEGGLALRLCAGMGHLARRLPRLRGKSRLGRTLAAKILAGKIETVLPVRLRDGTRLLLDPRGRTEAGAFYQGALDEDDLDFFRCCVGPQSVAIDIGANIGLVSIPLGRHLKSLGGRLLSVEPVANNAKRLRGNVRLNDMQEMAAVVECALSDSAGAMEIGRERGGGAQTGNAVLRPGGDNWTAPLEWTTVEVRRLDDVVVEQNLPRVDFIKIDVEGAELCVLRGGMQSISRFRPIIYGEFSGDLMPKFGGTFADVGTLFTPIDYLAMAFVHRLELEEVPFAAGRGNAVLCPREKIASLMERCTAARLK